MTSSYLYSVCKSNKHDIHNHEPKNVIQRLCEQRRQRNLRGMVDILTKIDIVGIYILRTENITTHGS
jgi:hypothetical protein